MPAQYVKPYFKRGMNDSADAEAICEARCIKNEADLGLAANCLHRLTDHQPSFKKGQQVSARKRALRS
jgi:hypothetical protein